MVLRPPKSPSSMRENPLEGLLDYEIAGEMASALGRAGRKVETSLSSLGEFNVADPAREPALRQAATAVYAYFVQRELCGLRRHDGVIREYNIPREVLIRLGAK